MELQKRIAAAQAGDRQARELLILDYAPLAFATACRITGQFCGWASEHSTDALMGLDQAVTAWRRGGASFIGLAKQIVAHRLSDAWRRERRDARLPVVSLELVVPRDANGELIFYMVPSSLGHDPWPEVDDGMDRAAERIRLRQRLGFPTPLPPKARSTIALVRRGIEYVADLPMPRNPRSWRAPLGDLVLHCGGSIKTWEHRRRILCFCREVLTGDYPMLREVAGL